MTTFSGNALYQITQSVKWFMDSVEKYVCLYVKYGVFCVKMAENRFCLATFGGSLLHQISLWAMW
jgi:hypothetical protein